MEVSVPSTAFDRLRGIANVTVRVNEPLAPYTRFQIGGPAAMFCDTADRNALAQALELVNTFAVPRMVIGGGTNLVVSDAGFDGIVLRYTGSGIAPAGNVLHVEAGAVLQDVVDTANALGLMGLETMTGIPGYLGGAIYGNAGAYGRSIQEIVQTVKVFDGEHIIALSNAGCRFRYRESVFKQRKDWIILSAQLRFETGEPTELNKSSAEIRAIRDAKYPPAMKCAGSIFKNLLLAELPIRVQRQVPAQVIREGKVPSAWFLEQVGAKGVRRGEIQVASYHANLIYNDGAGTAEDLVAIIQDLKQRVHRRFGLELEEEIQYVGFDYVETAA
jgi:UDP-N-acetylmuramate dehydrogenase